VLREAGELRMWAVDLNAGPAASLASFQLFDFLTVGAFEPRKGIYSMADRDHGSSITGRLQSAGPSDEICSQDSSASPIERRHFVSCELLSHPGFQTMEYGPFFRACRGSGLVFDMERRMGTAFTVMDHPAAGVLGMLHSGATLYDALAGMANALEHVDKTADGWAPSGGPAACALRDTLSTLRYLCERLRPLVSSSQQEQPS
jgi:hypothetical protein